MYSFNPQPIQDSLNDHSGFQFVCVLCIIIWGVLATLILISDDYRDSLFEKVGRVVIWFFPFLLVMTFSYWVSYTTGSVIIPKNEQVIGTLIGFQPEVFNIARSETSGKTTRTVIKEQQELYIVYMLPDESRVLLRANINHSYPQKAILYKN